VPEAIPPTTHGYKCRLVYVVGGRRVIGFGNDRGEGAHCHIGDYEHSAMSINQGQTRLCPRNARVCDRQWS
jgi:hypothetical protein